MAGTQSARLAGLTRQVKRDLLAVPGERPGRLLRRLARSVSADGHARTPPACPPGWRTGPPDFVGVGVQKAGTSWWYGLLLAHPRVAHRLDLHKELHYFDGHGDRPFDSADVARYHAFFPRPEGALTGEWTPRYLADFWTPRQLRAAAPDAKLLVLLRDPVDRYRSGITHELNLGARRSPRLAVEAMYRGLYHAQLTALLQHFPRDQVLVLQYEQCRDDPLPSLARTYHFLGLDDVGFVPPDLHDRVNIGPTEKLVLPVEVADDLRALCAPDVAALVAEFPEIDLGRWPNFCQLTAGR